MINFDLIPNYEKVELAKTILDAVSKYYSDPKNRKKLKKELLIDSTVAQ